MFRDQVPGSSSGPDSPDQVPGEVSPQNVCVSDTQVMVIRFVWIRNRYQEHTAKFSRLCRF
jgi:hypothetical protein